MHHYAKTFVLSLDVTMSSFSNLGDITLLVFAQTKNLYPMLLFGFVI